MKINLENGQKKLIIQLCLAKLRRDGSEEKQVN